MKSTDLPARVSTVFASDGDYNTIAQTSTTTTLADGVATQDVGFPPITRVAISSGGLPPAGKDMNGVLYMLSLQQQWDDAGGPTPFDSTFASAISGYPKGAVVRSSDSTGNWLNTSDGNVTNPEQSSSTTTNWIPIGFTGSVSITGLSGSSVTLTTLQAAKPVIKLYGTLTANIYLYLPAWVANWRIENYTTGSYQILLRTTTGTLNATIYSKGIFELYGNGTDVLFNLPGLKSESGGYMLPNGQKVMYGVYTATTLAANYDSSTGTYESASISITPSFTDNNGTFSFINIANVQLTTTDVAGLGQQERVWLGGGKVSGTSFTCLCSSKTANATMYIYWTAIGY